jgi:hypothetical protein
MKPLFIIDKWCDGNKAWGTSAWENNFLSSYKTFFNNNSDVMCFHFDEFNILNKNRNANEYLINLIYNKKPDFIFFVTNKFPNSSNNTISIKSLEIIKSLGIKIISFFGDLEHVLQLKIANLLKNYSTIVFYSALSSPAYRISESNIFRYSWVPKDPKFFFRGNFNGIIPVSYVGSPKLERIKLINYLIYNKIDVYCSGGERTNNLPVKKYCNILRNSKISLSFSRANSYHVINARTFEALLCGTMLLEQYSLETPKFFKPYVDYVPFFSRKDCLEKIKYYLANNIERETIARSGNQRVNLYFSNNRFWSEILKIIKSDKEIHTKVVKKKFTRKKYWELPLSNLTPPRFEKNIYKDFSEIRKLQFYFLNYVYENNFFNMIYINIVNFFCWPYLPYKLPYKILSYINRNFLKKNDTQ